MLAYCTWRTLTLRRLNSRLYFSLHQVYLAEMWQFSWHCWTVLFCTLVILDPRVDHTMDVLSPFISVLCYSDWLFHGESCPRLDVVHPGRVWSSSLLAPCIISFSKQLLVSLMVWPYYSTYCSVWPANDSVWSTQRVWSTSNQQAPAWTRLSVAQQDQ